MIKNLKKVSNLRVIDGGSQILINSIRVITAPKDYPPFSVEAIAYEEDTYLVISADKKIKEVNEHPIRLMTALINFRPEEIGTAVIKGKLPPYKIMAIVHDLNEDPICREEWVISSLDDIFRKSEYLKLRAIGMQMIGTIHGSIKYDRFVQLLRDSINRSSIDYLKKIWLITPTEFMSTIIEMFERVSAT